MIDLVDDSETYKISHPKGVIFTLRHWIRGKQDEVDQTCIIRDANGNFGYNVAREREIKLDYCLVDWDGITSKGEPIPCNSENKRKLPVGVFLWLIQEIDERAGLRMRDEEKKS